MQDLASGWTGKKPNKYQVTTPLILITDVTKEEIFLWDLHFCVIPCPWVNSVFDFQQLGKGNPVSFHFTKEKKSYTTDPIFC